MESRAQIIAVRVQWNPKVQLIFGKSTIYRKRRRITVSVSQWRSAWIPQPARKIVSLMQLVLFQCFKVFNRIEPRKQSMFKRCMFTYFKADSLLGIFMCSYIYLARKEEITGHIFSAFRAEWSLSWVQQ